MRRLALCLAIWLLVTLPALAQRNPNTNSGGGSNAGGGESREVVAPRESGSGGATGGGSVSSGGGSAYSGGGSFSSHSSGGGNPSGGAPTSSSGGNAPSGSREPVGSRRVDAGDREFISHSPGGKPAGMSVRPGPPSVKTPGNPAAAPATQVAGNQRANTAPVPGPPSNPCFGGSQANGQCVSCGAGGTLTNGRCFVCPSGQVDEGGLCHVRCEGNTQWNGIDCVGYPLGPEYGYRPSAGTALPLCSLEEESLDKDNARRRALDGQAASACLFDPFSAACQDLALQVDGVKQEIGRDWRALDRCRHGL